MTRLNASEDMGKKISTTIRILQQWRCIIFEPIKNRLVRALQCATAKIKCTVSGTRSR